MGTDQESFEDDGVSIFLDHLDMHFDEQLRCDERFGLRITTINLHRCRVHVFVQNCRFFHIKRVPQCILLLIFRQLADIRDNLNVSSTLYDE